MFDDDFKIGMRVYLNRTIHLYNLGEFPAGEKGTVVWSTSEDGVTHEFMTARIRFDKQHKQLADISNQIWVYSASSGFDNITSDMFSVLRDDPKFNVVVNEDGSFSIASREGFLLRRLCQRPVRYFSRYDAEIIAETMSWSANTQFQICMLNAASLRERNGQQYSELADEYEALAIGWGSI